MKIVLIIAMLLASCSDQQGADYISKKIEENTDPRIFSHVEPEIDVYYARFERTFGVEIGDIPAGFVSETDGVLGTCHQSKFLNVAVYSEIWINIDRWFDLTDRQKEFLIYHELGHCLLNRRHRSGTVKSGDDVIPASIMNPNGFANDETEDHISYYYHELIHRNSNYEDYQFQR